MTLADERREQQRASWEEFSGGWERWDHLVMPMLQPVGDEMVRLLDIGPTAQHLDVASGTGEPGLTIAAATPEGHVVLTDLSSGMLAVAEKNAAKRGITNIELRECSVDGLPFPDASFDSITCRFGFMFFPDPELAASELHRVLRPGGKLAASVWAEPQGNPWATIPVAAIGTEIELPTPPPDAPSMFRFAQPGSVSTVLQSAGFRDAKEIDVRSELSVDSAEEYWDYMAEVAAPIVAGLAQVDAAARQRIDALVIDEVGGFEVDGRPRLPLHARCIVAAK